MFWWYCFFWNHFFYSPGNTKWLWHCVKILRLKHIPPHIKWKTPTCGSTHTGRRHYEREGFSRLVFKTEKRTCFSTDDDEPSRNLRFTRNECGFILWKMIPSVSISTFSRSEAKVNFTLMNNMKSDLDSKNFVLF